MVTTAAVIGSAPIDMPPTASGSGVAEQVQNALGDQPGAGRVERDLLAVEVIAGLLARGQREVAELQGPFPAPESIKACLSYTVWLPCKKVAVESVGRADVCGRLKLYQFGGGRREGRSAGRKARRARRQ